MVELIANGSVAVLPHATTETQDRPEGVRGRLLKFVNRYTKELTTLKASSLEDLQRQVELVTFAHRFELQAHVPYDPETAAIKIVNRWKHLGGDGYYTICESPDFAYCY